MPLGGRGLNLKLLNFKIGWSRYGDWRIDSDGFATPTRSGRNEKGVG